MEEVLWMAFFENVHNPLTSNILDQNTNNPKFEKFYKDHIRKLLLVRHGKRYLSKGNYNITRLEYLLKLFPDARFVIPVRQPATHVASLMKQHKLFCQGQEENRRALEHLRRTGHFEFGLDFRPINTGDKHQTKEIKDTLKNGEEVRAWSRYWRYIHRYLADTLAENPDLEKAAMIVRYEDFCASRRETLEAIQNHCDLMEDASVIAKYEGNIKLPTYYKINFTEKELRIIEEETQETEKRFYPISTYA